LGDCTAEIDAGSVDTLRAIADAADTAGVRWMVTGAMARTLVFEKIHGQPSGRFTHDWDLGVQVEDWSRFRALERQLTGHHGFEANGRQRQRVHAPNGIIVDLIPFGGVEGDDASIRWDGAAGHRLNVAGFRQSAEAAYRVCLNDRVTIRVVSPPGLALLKLMAWQDRHLEHDRDAEDLAYLLRHYHTLLADGLYERYADMTAAMDYDIERAGAGVLGMQAARIAGEALARRIGGWLDDAIASPEASPLLAALGRYLRTRDEAAVLGLVQAFRAGWAM
jgi:predicted nucleotidyltransferase